MGRMREVRRHVDVGSMLIIVITLVLFVAALFTKGLTHELLLEAAVFLVSVKLVIMAYKSAYATASADRKLDEICEKLTAIEARQVQS